MKEYSNFRMQKGREMAQIDLDTIEKIDKERCNIQEKVKTTYSVFSKEGEKYIQIDTYGKKERMDPEKISQSLQFDEKTARFFVKLFLQEFELL